MLVSEHPSPPSFTADPGPPLGSPRGLGEGPSSPSAVQESSRESSGSGQGPSRAHFAHPLSGPRPCLQRPCVCRTDCIEL